MPEVAFDIRSPPKEALRSEGMRPRFPLTELVFHRHETEKAHFASGVLPSALQTEIEPLSCESGLENRRRRAVFQRNETKTDFNYLIITFSEGVIIMKKDKKIRPRITKGLVDICNEYAVDYALAEQYINNHKLTPQEVTYAAICLEGQDLNGIAASFSCKTTSAASAVLSSGMPSYISFAALRSSLITLSQLGSLSCTMFE